MSLLENVNTTNIKEAIQLGCKTMQNVFNADDNQVPFFGSTVWPEASLSFSAHHSESHVPGRHLNALLNAEEVVGSSLLKKLWRTTAVLRFFPTAGYCLYLLIDQQSMDCRSISARIIFGKDFTHSMP